MKKLLSFLLCVFLSLQADSQIYSRINYLDKFDDVVKTENVKTLIEEVDSTFIIEIKGRTPITYYVLGVAEFDCIGDSKVNNHERLIDNVFGYQKAYCVSNVPLQEWAVLNEEQKNKHTFGLIHRVVSKYDFEFVYEGEYFWLLDFNENKQLGTNIRRIVYCK